MKITQIFLTFLIIIGFNFPSFAANMTLKQPYEFSFELIDGQEMKLADLQGRVVLIVNTASKCGFTPQYQGLQQLYEQYKDRGLTIIAVPSADFANQEFAQTSQIKEFTQKEFHITFPITTLNNVRGSEAHPFYLWANDKSGFLGSPKWNFHKYLIDRDGNLAAWFSSATKPQSTKIVNKIEELL